jgi:hypothetical protein
LISLPVAYQGNDLRYEHLNVEDHSIRLLKILPPQPTSPNQIECQLYIDSLYENPRFDALSHAWGDISKTDVRQILLNDREFVVSPQLESILFHLRAGGLENPIWIDFICINQKDETEKTNQIAMMKDIYSAAGRVLIWLGPIKKSLFLPDCMTKEPTADEQIWFGDLRDQDKVDQFLASSHKFIQVPLSMRAAFPQNYIYGSLCLIYQLSQDKHLNEIGFFLDPFYRSQILKELQSLMSSQWWDRIWVVQGM